ncbi:MAG: DUF177 domain-containing protein [Chloroherpetonaceae bacterium]|nr:DUF177 domain-containing protein [Chloroherpetonaceae bacterium]
MKQERDSEREKEKSSEKHSGDARVPKEVQSFPPLVKIKITGLSLGKHTYEFVLKAVEFGDQEISEEAFPGEIFVSVALSKMQDAIFAEVWVEAEGCVPCNRCLSPIQRPLYSECSVAILLHQDAKLTKEEESIADDVRLMKKNDSEIDLTRDVREALLLSIPMRNVCPKVLAEDPEADDEEIEEAEEFIIPDCRYEESEKWRKELQDRNREAAVESEWLKALKQLKKN